jgi:hypothetical protein
MRIDILSFEHHRELKAKTNKAPNTTKFSGPQIFPKREPGQLRMHNTNPAEGGKNQAHV